MTPRDLAALSPMFTLHINPNGRFELKINLETVTFCSNAPAGL